MKHLSIKSTAYPSERNTVIKALPMYIIQKFWTNFYNDRYNAVVTVKRSLAVLAIVITSMSSCRTTKTGSTAVINLYPDYNRNVVSAEVIESNDTLYHYNTTPAEFRDLIMSRERTAFIISYKEGE